MKTAEIVEELVLIKQAIKRRDYGAEQKVSDLIAKLCVSGDDKKKATTYVVHKDWCITETDPEGYAPCNCRNAADDRDDY